MYQGGILAPMIIFLNVRIEYCQSNVACNIPLLLPFEIHRSFSPINIIKNNYFSERCNLFIMVFFFKKGFFSNHNLITRRRHFSQNLIW